MIFLDDVTKDWAVEGVWKIAPAGLSWIKEGAHIIVGEGASIGEGARIGEGASIGEGARIGEWARIGEGARIGEWARIGEGASIGEGARIGEWASIGKWARIGDRSFDAIDLGWADGYRKCVACVDGVAYIGAGCRWFTLADALKHWGNKPNRELTMCLMMAAVHIAGYKGWKHGDE